MLVTGEAISADEARQFGLINRIVRTPTDSTAAQKQELLQTQTRQLASQIASLSWETLALGKAAFYRQMAMKDNLDAAYVDASNVMVENLAMDDSCEGLTAFLEKRSPQWKQNNTTNKQ
jgi:enoyl-CoA hydratase/carnithine racemase